VNCLKRAPALCDVDIGGNAAVGRRERSETCPDKNSSPAGWSPALQLRCAYWSDANWTWPSGCPWQRRRQRLPEYWSSGRQCTHSRPFVYTRRQRTDCGITRLFRVVECREQMNETWLERRGDPFHWTKTRRQPVEHHRGGSDAVEKEVASSSSSSSSSLAMQRRAASSAADVGSGSVVGRRSYDPFSTQSGSTPTVPPSRAEHAATSTRRAQPAVPAAAAGSMESIRSADITGATARSDPGARVYASGSSGVCFDEKVLKQIRWSRLSASAVWRQGMATGLICQLFFWLSAW